MPRYTYALPDPDKGWNLWSGGKIIDEGRDLVDVVGKRSDIVVGVPASYGTTFAVRIPSTDSNLFESMVYAQIEKRGLGHGSMEETVFDYEIVEQDGNESLLAVNVMSSTLPDVLFLNQAAGYAPSALLWKMPDDGLYLWKEQRRLVMGARRDGRLTHVQALSSAPELSAGSAQEINLSMLSLQAEGLIEDNLTLNVSGDVEGDRAVFENSVKRPVVFVGSPETDRKAKINSRFMPTSVTKAKSSRKFVFRSTIVAILALAGYAVAGFFIWKKAEASEAEIADLERRVAISEPDVQLVQESEMRWRTLEPAFDYQYFPLVQLNEITRALPGSGVLVREFKTTDRRIRIRGQARDVQLAFRLVEDLRDSEAFVNYEWQMPQPKVERDNTATFEIQGDPKNARTES